MSKKDDWILCWSKNECLLYQMIDRRIPKAKLFWHFGKPVTTRLEKPGKITFPNLLHK
jgi:hypothetical protein